MGEANLADLLRSMGARPGLRTNLTPAYLRWRYGFTPLAYRAVTLDADVGEGLAIYRLRRRGAALECALCEVLTPPQEPGAHQALVRSVVHQTEADYVVRLGGPVADRAGFVRAPGHGPILTWYPLATDAPGGHIRDWALTLGDIELF